MVETITKEPPETAPETELSEVEKVWGEGANKYIIDADKLEDPDWLAEGLVVKQGLTLTYGASGIGKTTFILYLIDALQKGSSFFGRCCKKSKVLLVEQDESPPLLKSHKQLLGLPNKLWVVNVTLRWDNLSHKFNDDLPSILSSCHPDVVLIDAYTSLGLEDINHPVAGLTFDELRRLSQKYNCAFVILHHTGKTGQ